MKNWNIGNNELVSIQYDKLIDSRETLKAYLFVIDDEEVWLPKSQVEDIRETENIVDIPLWLAKKKGLQTYEA